MFNLGILIILLNSYSLIAHSSSVCSDSVCENSENLYDRDSNKFMMEYHKTIASYKNETCDECSCYDNVIETDLKPFKSGINQDMLKSCSSRGVKYQLISGKWYRSKECSFPSRCEGVEYFLFKLRTSLPDMELCINFHDWPQLDKHHGIKFPIFSFSKTEDYFDIMYPAWSFWRGGPAIKLIPEGLGRWDLGRELMSEAANKWPWKKKKKTGFFRGSRTSSERDTLVLLSRKEAKLVDAAYTKNQAWKSDKDTLGVPPAEEVSLQDHCQYRYLFNFRGVTASFRFKYLFLCKSLVIHVGNEWNEFFYFALKPWIHYVPLSKSASEKDYRSLLKFLKNENEISKEIAKKGHEFVEKYLTMEDVLCYWKKLLLQYSNLLTYKPKEDPDLILIKNQNII